MNQPFPHDRTAWFASEVYYPEDRGAAHYFTEIFREVAKTARTRVVCAQPLFYQKREKSPKNETFEGVEIHRCFSTVGNRHKIFWRIINAVTFCTSLFFFLLFRVRRNDIIVCGCYPPSLPFFTAALCKLKRAKHILYEMDIYPDLAVAAGVIRKKSISVKVFFFAKKLLYSSASKTIVISRDMKTYLCDRYKVPEDRVEFIPLFIDTSQVFPTKRDENKILRDNHLLDKFVIGLAGNIGAVHDIELLLQAARHFQSFPDLRFLVIGAGKKRKWLEETVIRERISNFVFVDWQPRGKTCEIANACDVAISALYIPGLFGLACASRTGSILAAGKPMIAVVEPETELNFLINEYHVGWRVDPGNCQEFIRAIETAYKDRDLLTEKGKSARNAVVSYMDSEIILPQYVKAITNCWNNSN